MSPAGALVQKADKVSNKGANGASTTIDITGDGRGPIPAKTVDLSGLNLTLPVPFLLRVGDDVGGLAIPLDSKGKL